MTPYVQIAAVIDSCGLCSYQVWLFDTFRFKDLEQFSINEKLELIRGKVGCQLAVSRLSLCTVLTFITLARYLIIWLSFGIVLSQPRPFHLRGSVRILQSRTEPLRCHLSLLLNSTSIYYYAFS